MKGMFKTSAIALAILGLASTGYAGTVSGAFFGGEGLDFQPRNGDLDFVSVFPAAGIGTVRTYAIHPSYDWGFRLYGGLTFCGNDDLTISWLRFYTTDHNDFGTPVTAGGSDVSSQLRFHEDATWGNIFSQVNFNLDDVYGVFGHTVHLGPWSVRYAAGVEWFKLNSDFSVEGVNVSTLQFQPSGVEIDYEANNTTRGVGPRVEFDFAYAMPYGFYMFARPNASLLISSRNVSLVPSDETTFDTYDFTKRHVVIPRIGIRLGVGFTWGYGAVGGEGVATPFDSTLVTVEAGWHAESYIHAIERPEGFENTGSGDDARSNFTTRTSNYGQEGFFIGVKLATSWL